MDFSLLCDREQIDKGNLVGFQVALVVHFGEMLMNVNLK